MPEYDQERVLSGGAVDTEDKAELAVVRANLRSLVRVNKGLPPDPVNLDVDILSQLPDSPVIDDSTPGQTTEVVPVDISRLSTKNSVVGLSLHNGRLEKIERKKAA